jgi:hypothetical protein
MAEPQEAVTEVSDAAQGVEETAGKVEQSAAGTVGETTAGAAGLLAGVLTSGFLIAGVAGFVVGFALGVAVGRSATPPPPRWQVWR